MTVWRLELLRIWRTRRWLAVAGTYTFFAILGPVTARYLAELLSTVGDVQVEVPPPTATSSMAQYVSNASQLGVLAVVIVAASALAFDQRVEAAAFYRTRLRSVGRTVLPRWLVSTALAIFSLLVATAVAWGLTALLIEAPGPGAMVLGTVAGMLYLAFVTALTALMASWIRGVLPLVFATVAVLIVLPALSLISALEPWLPSELVGAVVDLVAGGSALDLVPAMVVTAAVIPGLLAWAVARLDRREV